MNQMNGLALAYLGDAYYELKVREHLVNKGLTKVNDLHQAAIRFTAATGQAKVIDFLLKGQLSEEEISFFKRGRNANTIRKPKNADLATYHHATGLETLFGFLYTEQRFTRLDELFQIATEVIEQNEDSN